MAPPLCYVAGKYRGASAWQVEQNIRAAEALGYRLALAGLYPVIPHANTRFYFEGAQADGGFWLGATLELMRRCDAVALVEGWSDSAGAMLEHEEAERLGLPVLYPTHDLNGEVAAFVALLKARRA